MARFPCIVSGIALARGVARRVCASDGAALAGRRGGAAFPGRKFHAVASRHPRRGDRGAGLGLFECTPGLQPLSGQAALPPIKPWAAANPKRLEQLLNQNPSFVFFRELPLADPTSGPVGALGVPLAPGRSIAVDPRYVPLGAPVFLATTFPASTTPLTRLVLAQDTGGAIRNPVRADFFWGFGPEAGAQAGRMRQQGRMWALLPKDLKPAPTGPVTP